MDLTKNELTLADTGIPGGAVVDDIASSVKNLAAGVRNKAKAKSAQKTADAGGYWTLRPFLKSLIPIPQYILTQVAGQGITENAVLTLPEQGASESNTSIINQLKMLSGGTDEKTVSASGVTEGTNLKKYIPYIIGIGLIGIIIYFIIKTKK